jgi:hypothetical protein
MSSIGLIYISNRAASSVVALAILPSGDSAGSNGSRELVLDVV